MSVYFDYQGKDWSPAKNYYADTFEPGAIKMIPALAFAKDTSITMITEPFPVGNKYLFRTAFKKSLVKIYNDVGILLDGKIIFKKGSHYKIDLSGFPDGIYYVSVLSAAEPVQLRRVIFKKTYNIY